MTKVKLPINVNAAAYVAAVASLDDTDFRDYVKNYIARNREYYYRELDKLGLTYVRSAANFILVKTGLDSRYVDAEFLKRGYMIRPGADFGLKEYIRISIGTEAENQDVIRILAEILEQSKEQK